MEARHVRWAMQHDWYRGHSYHVESATWIVTVRDDVPENGPCSNIVFTDYTKLRHWAGY